MSAAGRGCSFCVTRLRSMVVASRLCVEAEPSTDSVRSGPTRLADAPIQPAAQDAPVSTQEQIMGVVNPNIHILHQASDALADAVEHVGRSVVAIHASRHGSASGVLWRSGVVVT